MTNDFWEELKTELKKGETEIGHPFRYGTLGTLSAEKLPILRTIVLRKVSDALQLTFYTDGRSKKIEQITANKGVCMLFYNPKELVQLKVEGTATIIKDKALLQKTWKDIQPNNRKDYTTKNTPGTLISEPNTIDYLNEENHFCMVEIEPLKIEYLKLKRTDHVRVQFLKTEGRWQGSFLVP